MTIHSRMINTLLRAALQAAFLLGLLSPGISLHAQQGQPDPGGSAASPQKNPNQQAAEGPERLHVLVGRSLVINSPVRLRRVSIADPNIVDAIITNPSQLVLNGKIPGGVSLVLWDENDQNQTFDVFVDLDFLAISQKIREVFPKEPVEVEAAKDTVIISGHASSKAVADRITQIVTATTPKVISLLDWPAKPTQGEILLEVKFAEVNRTALSQFGFNLISVPGSTTRTLAATGTQQFGPIALNQLQATGTQLSQANLTLSDLLNIFVFRPDINLGATVKALQQQNLLQILAEPNVLTQTGKEASFLAGGEFPYPVVQGGGAGTVPTVTVLFKEFGVKLNFAPELTEDGKIHLKVRPEVSALDFTNSLTLSGFVIPAISTRRVEAEIELEDGQSFAIAGLVDDRLTKLASKMPGLGDIPILGYLFRSKSLQKSKTELLVVVTPHKVKPLNADQVPGGPQFPDKFLAPVKLEPGNKEKSPAQKKD